MDDAEMRTSTLPPQCGHFFRYGPATFSIFSVKRPHFRHLYSYRGTDILLVGLRIAEYDTGVGWAWASRSVLNSRYVWEAREKPFFRGSGGSSSPRIRRMALSGGHADRQPGRHHAAGAAHPERSGLNRLRRHSAHTEIAESLRHPEIAGQLSRAQRNDALLGVADQAGGRRQDRVGQRCGDAAGFRSGLPAGDALRASQDSGGAGAAPFGAAGAACGLGTAAGGAFFWCIFTAPPRRRALQDVIPCQEGKLHHPYSWAI